MSWLAILTLLLPIIEAILKLLAGGTVAANKRPLAAAVFKRFDQVHTAFIQAGFNPTSDEVVNAD